MKLNLWLSTAVRLKANLDILALVPYLCTMI